MGYRTFTGLVLDVRSTAELLGTTDRTVRGMIARRLIPFRKLNGRVVLVRSELERYIENLPGISVDDAMKNMGQRHG